ncbi:hypothetical protein QBC44DRAFT_403079 [Cladorrhinum sp. PSN332]|nr:hypothetical protein QBC44DRAFT_403079 [Cladorrhinum sp. PSN332]
MSSHSRRHNPREGPISQQPPIEFMDFPPPSYTQDPSGPRIIHAPRNHPQPDGLAQIQLQASSSAPILPNNFPVRPPRTHQATSNPNNDIRPFQRPRNWATDSLPVFHSTQANQGLISHPKPPPKPPRPKLTSPPLASRQFPPKSAQVPAARCANCGVSLTQTPHPYTANLPCKHPSVCRNSRCLKAFYGTKSGYALPYQERDQKPLYCQTQGCGREIEAWCRVDCILRREGDERLFNLARRETAVLEEEEKRRKEKYEERRLKVVREVEEKRREEDRMRGYPHGESKNSVTVGREDDVRVRANDTFPDAYETEDDTNNFEGPNRPVTPCGYSYYNVEDNDSGNMNTHEEEIDSQEYLEPGRPYTPSGYRISPPLMTKAISVGQTNVDALSHEENLGTFRYLPPPGLVYANTAAASITNNSSNVPIASKQRSSTCCPTFASIALALLHFWF